MYCKLGRPPALNILWGGQGATEEEAEEEEEEFIARLRKESDKVEK